MKHLFKYVSVVSLTLLLHTEAYPAVVLSQDTLSLKTWAEGAPDINPWFEILHSNSHTYPMYPYTLRANFGTSTSVVGWRELKVENEYLVCRVLPDLGGHLYSCLDKTTNTEMFYANPVVRKGDIGLRGAWVSMGIESNFPVTHSLTSISPITFGTQSHSDGSAGIWVGNIDRQTGMEWRVEYVLRPGSRMLEQQVTLYNRSDMKQPFQWWANGAIPLEDLSDHFAYPTHVVGDLGFYNFDSWPLSLTKGDQSIMSTLTGQLEIFCFGSHENYFSAYHPTSKMAVTHVSDPLSEPGKKIWAWGPGQYGNSWVVSNLTENFSSYFEIQGGTTLQQNAREWLEAQSSRQFTEYWIPAHNLDGVSRANAYGVLYMGRKTVNSQNVLSVQLNVTHLILGAQIKVLSGTSVVFQDIASLNPSTPYSQVISPLTDGVVYTFQLTDSAGQLLLSHTENTYDAAQASDVHLGPQPPPALPPLSSDTHYSALATNDEQYQKFIAATQDYIQGLAQFPSSAILLKGHGRLAYWAGQYDLAVTELTKSIANAPSDDEAHYYLGLADAALGRNAAAIAEWSGLLGSGNFKQAATFELGVIHAQMGDWGAAVPLLDAVPTVRAGALEIAVLRHMGNASGAQNKLTQWLAVSPTDLFLRYEGGLLGSPSATLTTELGSEPERVLNLVDDYIRLGFNQEAYTLLGTAFPTGLSPNQTEPGAVAPQNNALVAYYRGYIHQKLGMSAVSDFSAASGMSMAYLFPNRLSSFPVLQAAVASNPNDGSAHYLLCLLNLSHGQIDAGISQCESARGINKTLPALDRTLGRIYLDVKMDPASALPVLSEGNAIEPNNSDLQDALSRANTLIQAQSNCTFRLQNPSSIQVGSDPHTLAIQFTGPSNCQWQAALNEDWMAVTSPNSGQGSGSVTYAIAGNPHAASRSKTIVIAGIPLTIQQSGATCSYQLTSPNADVPPQGGIVSIGVQSPSDSCTPTVNLDSNWMTLTSNPTLFNGLVSVSVAADNGVSRTGVVHVGQTPFAIQQAGAQSNAESLNDLSHIVVYPNPWKAHQHDSQPLRFTPLSDGAEVKLFTLSSHLVRRLSAVNGNAEWDLKNDAGENVASGVYLYTITDGHGNKTRGKLIVVR